MITAANIHYELGGAPTASPRAASAPSRWSPGALA